MDDRLALMAAIVANPEEDTPRLALADWLDEHGDEHDRARAEFIRLDVELTATSGNTPGWRRKQTRGDRLLKDHGPAWLGPLLRVGCFNLSSEFAFAFVFDRGLIGTWSESQYYFLTKRYQKAFCGWFPRVGVDTLRLHGRATRAAEVAASPALGWVSRLEWEHSGMRDAGLTDLAGSPHLGRLYSFTVGLPRLTDDGLASFAATARMPNLRHFGLSGGKASRYTAAGVLEVVRGDRFPNLCRLALDGDPPRSLDLGRLFADPAVSRLKELSVDLTGRDAVLVRSPHLTGLERLTLYWAGLTDGDAAALLENPALKNLRELALQYLNEGRPRLKRPTERRLRDRFGTGLRLEYANGRR